MALLSRAIAERLNRFDNRSRKFLWRLRNRGPHETRPVFIFGAQRSGTGMLGACLGASPEVENLGESDARAFEKYWLRDLPTVDRLISRCPYPVLVFKPLKDSHRARELLAVRSGARAVWAYRNYADRINSAVRQFGRRPIEVFTAFQAGDRSRWQLQGMSARTADTLSGMDLGAFSQSDGAALMWWIRNSLYFDQGLDRDPRVWLWSYDRFVQQPDAELRGLLAHLGVAFDPHMLREVHSRSIGKDPVPGIAGHILELCKSLHGRLEASIAARAAAGSPQP